MYAPVMERGLPVGAVEVYRKVPPFNFWTMNMMVMPLLLVTTVPLFYLLTYRQFRRAAREITEYNARLDAEFNSVGQSYLATIRSLAKALELRDLETEGHAERVVALSVWIGDRLFIARECRTRLVLGAYLHDLGKIGISDLILQKRGRLTPDEFRIMQGHVMKGFQIINEVGSLEPAFEVVLYHHEKWDGRGYPHGLAGEAIPVTARIFAVADVFDALISRRPYKLPMCFEEAKAEIMRDSGRHFDPEIAAVFLQMTEGEFEAMTAEIGERGIYHTVREAMESLLDYPLSGQGGTGCRPAPETTLLSP